MTATIAAPIAPANAPTPLALLNSKIVEAKAAANAELARLRLERKQHENTPLEIPPGTSVAAQVGLQTEHISLGHMHTYRVRNFSPERFASAILDDARNKALLEHGLRYAKAQHVAALKRKAQAPEPTNEPEGRHVFQAVDDREPCVLHTQSKHEAPRGGLYGVPEPLNIVAELSRLQENIAAFPLTMTFEAITGALNAVASQLREQEPPPPMAKRMDKPFVPLHG